MIFAPSASFTPPSELGTRPFSPEMPPSHTKLADVSQWPRLCLSLRPLHSLAHRSKLLTHFPYQDKKPC